MTDPVESRPRVLIEDWLPIVELGIESRRERAFVAAIPDLFSLHVWWARRPLVASAGVILASLLPAWSEDLREDFQEDKSVITEAAYKAWFLRLCGILGDPVEGRRVLDRANAEGRKIKGNGYGYKQAYKNSPHAADLDLLHRLLRQTWGDLPTVIDPTAGGGSIPYEAVRYGLPAIANDLNQVAAAVLRAGVEIPAAYGPEIADEVEKWGSLLIQRIGDRLRPFFVRADEQEKVVAYLHARTVACPRTGKPVPLAPNWWISKAKGQEVAVRIVTERDGTVLEAPEFDILHGRAAVNSRPDEGTVARGKGRSPWDELPIDDDYIKAEAQAGRMGSVLYAVAVRVPQLQSSGRIKWVRQFRAPTATDLEALDAAQKELSERLPAWLETAVVPAGEIRDGLKTNEPLRYGITRWRDMFSPRQLLVHGTFVEEHGRIAAEIEAEVGGPRASAIAGLLGIMASKALNWNSFLSSWDTGRDKIRSVFDRHDFSFKWSFAEFEGAEALWQWAHERNVVNLRAVATTLLPAAVVQKGTDVPAPGRARVTRGSAASLEGVPDGSQTLVCIDPPYYDNVMYGELSEFFGVWEQATVGRAWPDLMPDGSADLKNEAVANPARFKEFGRRRQALADSDYEAKMLAIFAECRRVLRPDGVMTVMFTHKRAEAWDALGMALLEAGFSIETSWPTHTESEQSMHQAEKNAAESTIMLVCRQRTAEEGRHVFFEDIEGDVRRAASDAVARFSEAGIGGVDLLLSTYGPALSVISSHWPVYSSEADESGKARLLRPEEALGAAREEVVRMRRLALVGRPVEFDPLTDFVLLAWSTFQAVTFPYDEARRLALAVGGLDVDALVAARIVVTKGGTVSLCAPGERLRRRGDDKPGVRPDVESFTGPVVDAVHTVLYVAEQDGLADAKALVDRTGLASDARFVACLQGLVHAMPRAKAKGKWAVPEAGVLDALVSTYFPEVDVPEEWTGRLDVEV